MESSKLTDDELIELAQKELELLEQDTKLDVSYYQQLHSIKDGNHLVITNHLYQHYNKWSSDPVSLITFVDVIELHYKNEDFLKIDKQNCTIDLDKLLGEYVKKERRKEKEKRFRKVSCTKPKT